eukprot:407239_1
MSHQMALFVTILFFLASISFATLEVVYIDTPLSGGSFVNGAMFDICAKSPNNINIYSIDINCQQSGSQQVEIYIATETSDSYATIKDNEAAWTKIHDSSHTCLSSGSLTVLGSLFDPTTYPSIAISKTITNGQCRGFYVTLVSNNIAGTPGTTEGSVYSSNNDIEIKEGIGRDYSFGTTTITPFVFNGRIHYQVYSVSPSPDLYRVTATSVEWQTSINSQCNIEFGTQAASIHNYEQWQVAIAAHFESGSNYIGIGLQSTDNGN